MSFVAPSSGLPKTHSQALLFRVLGWTVLYVLPVHLVAIGNLRGFSGYGRNPGNSSLVCWRTGLAPRAQSCDRTALGPSQMSEYAQQLGEKGHRGYWSSIIMALLGFLIYAAIFAMRSDSLHQVSSCQRGTSVRTMSTSASFAATAVVTS